MGVTILDIAKAVNLSKATVSRAFVNPELVQPDTLRRIRETAADMGYMPNAIARAMITKRTGNLAFIIYGKQAPVITNPFYGPILEAVIDKTQQLGYSLFIASDDDLRMPSGDVMLQKQVDGVILASRPDMQMIGMYERRGTPIVLVNHYLDYPGVSCVLSDDHVGTQLAVKHLYEIGRRRIGLLQGNFTAFIKQRRYRAYCEALRDCGLCYDERIVQSIEPNASDAYRCARELLSLPIGVRPDALVCTNDTIAVGVIKAALRLGLSVPDDLAVTGYDDSSLCTVIEPELTSVSGGKEAMGEQAVTLLADRIGGKPQSIVNIGASLKVRASTVASEVTL